MRFDSVGRFLAELSIHDYVSGETRSSQIGRENVRESESSLMHKVAREALCLEGAMCGQSRISYACAGNSSATVEIIMAGRRPTVVLLHYVPFPHGGSVTATLDWRYCFSFMNPN